MLTDQIADLLKSARKAAGLSQKEVAGRAQVSTRLWAEVERGERPNVSLTTAIRMLGEVGVTVRLPDPLGASRELRNPGSAAAARSARAAVRRATWTGRQIRLEQEGSNDPSRASGHGVSVAARGRGGRLKKSASKAGEARSHRRRPRDV